jgi:hypothetical protein
MRHAVRRRQLKTYISTSCAGRDAICTSRRSKSSSGGNHVDPNFSEAFRLNQIRVQSRTLNVTAPMKGGRTSPDRGVSRPAPRPHPRDVLPWRGLPAGGQRLVDARKLVGHIRSRRGGTGPTTEGALNESRLRCEVVVGDIAAIPKPEPTIDDCCIVHPRPVAVDPNSVYIPEAAGIDVEPNRRPTGRESSHRRWARRENHRIVRKR